MRITGGTLRGRVFEHPDTATTRVMLDRVRVALFNILEHRDWNLGRGNILYQARVLDAFAGSGAVAFECLSREAAHATLFDMDRDALAIAKRNADKLGVTARCAILSADALRPSPAPQPCDLIILDPPYRKGLIPISLQSLQDAGWISDNALIIAATAKKEPLDIPDAFSCVLTRSHADTMLHFLRKR